MRKKIFRSTCAVVIVVLISSLILIMGVLYQYFENQMKTEPSGEAM